MENKKIYGGTCAECANCRDGLCRMHGHKYRLPESGRCDYGHYKLVGKCPVCGQKHGADEVIRALVEAMTKQRDLCDICANKKEQPGHECEKADCCCSVCESDCSCARCDNGSNFRYGGGA